MWCFNLWVVSLTRSSISIFFVFVVVSLDTKLALNTLTSCLILLTLDVHHQAWLKWLFNCSFEQMGYIYPNNWIYLYIEFLVSVSVLDGFCLVEFSSKYELYLSACISDNIWILDIMVFTCWTLHFSCFLLAYIHHTNWSIL